MNLYKVYFPIEKRGKDEAKNMPNINKAIKLSTIEKSKFQHQKQEKKKKKSPKEMNLVVLIVVNRNQWIYKFISNRSKYALHYKCHANDQRSSCKQNDQLETAKFNVHSCRAYSFK